MNNEVRVTNIRSLIITSLIIVVVITMGTFAWLNYRSKDTAMVLTIGDINDIQITLKPYQLDLELSPVLTYTSLDANEEYVTVSVVNNSSTAQYISLFYDINEIDSSLVSNDFKYTVLKSTDNFSTSNVDTSGNFLNANTTNDFYILDRVSIPANTTWYYRVYTWVDGTNNPNISNAVFKADMMAAILGNKLLSVGDYISYTPVQTAASSNAIDPSELNLWRVIAVYGNGKSDIISVDVSSKKASYSGKNGYKNLVGSLNVYANMYETPGITVGSRHFGYNGQTEYITDTTYLSKAIPWECSTGANCTPDPDNYEYAGGGDTLYMDDYNLVNTVFGTTVANAAGTSTPTIYWVASRSYWYLSIPTAYLIGRNIKADGTIHGSSLYIWDTSSGGTTYTGSNAVRPIVTLRAGLTYTGSGTNVDPYVVN